MKRELTKEQKKLFRAYYFDKARIIGGQVLMVVFGLFLPAMRVFTKMPIPIWICLSIAGVGLILVLTAKSSRAIDEEEKRMNR